MRKKGFMVLVVMALLVGITSSVAFAGKNPSEWIAARNSPNIYYQYVNQYGGNDWDGVRWLNQNSYRVKISVKFSYRPTGASAGERMVYLEGGNTYSEIVQLGPNVNFSFMVDKD